MYVLNAGELCQVSGSEITCSVGFPSGVVCKGTAKEFGDAIAAGYNYAVAKTTDLFCWLGGV